MGLSHIARAQSHMWPERLYWTPHKERRADRPEAPLLPTAGTWQSSFPLWVRNSLHQDEGARRPPTSKKGLAVRDRVNMMGWVRDFEVEGTVNFNEALFSFRYQQQRGVKDKSRLFKINKGIIFCIAKWEWVHFNPCYKSEANCFDWGNLAIMKRVDKVGHYASRCIEARCPRTEGRAAGPCSCW